MTQGLGFFVLFQITSPKYNRLNRRLHTEEGLQEIFRPTLFRGAGRPSSVKSDRDRTLPFSTEPEDLPDNDGLLLIDPAFDVIALRPAVSIENGRMDLHVVIPIHAPAGHLPHERLTGARPLYLRGIQRRKHGFRWLTHAQRGADTWV
jgi:hypothetical protein